MDMAELPDTGWVKLYRSLLDSHVWGRPHATRSVAVYLLLSANHKPAWWRGIRLEVGQCVRSLTRIQDDCGVSRKQARTAIAHLQEDGFLTVDAPGGAQQGHRLTICNYERYQAGAANEGTPGAHQGHRTRMIEEEESKNERSTTCAPPGAGAGTVSDRPKARKPTKPEIHQAATEAVLADTDWASDEIKNLFAEWAAERLDTGKPATERALRMAVKKLDGHDVAIQAETLRQAIAGSYQGLFPERVRLSPTQAVEQAAMLGLDQPQEFTPEEQEASDRWHEEEYAKYMQRQSRL